MNSCNWLQVLQIDWKEDKIPTLVLYDGVKLTYKDLVGNIEFKIGKEKYCTGIVDIEELRPLPCRKNIIVDKGLCTSCNSRDLFKYCLYCNGTTCYARSGIVKDYCDNEHYIYLAFFPDSLVKVGTVHKRRKNVRLLEQGALYYIYLAKCQNGFEARLLENQIAKLGVKSRVTSKYKILHLDYPEKDYVVDLLNTTIIYIKENIQNVHIYETNIHANNETLEKLNGINQMISIWQGEYLEGEIICVVGTLLIFKNGECFYKYDLKKIYGNKIFIIN